MPSIGIGCLSYNRPLHLQHWIEQIAKFSPEDAIVHIAEDTDKDRHGVAYRSNECLRALKDCDFVFLFNDDCFPVKKGFTEYFIEAHKQTGLSHFLLMKESNATKIIAQASDKDIPDCITVNFFDQCNGAFMFLTKEAIEKVGAFNEEFLTYGYEHADYSTRIYKSGLNKFGAYAVPEKATDYLYSLDLEPESDLHRKLKHKGSMPSKEALKHVAKALPIYQKQNPIYIPL